MNVNQLNSRDGLLASLAERSAPLAASTVDGHLRDGAATLAERLEAVRRNTTDEGSCPFTGWES